MRDFATGGSVNGVEEVSLLPCAEHENCCDDGTTNADNDNEEGPLIIQDGETGLQKEIDNNPIPSSPFMPAGDSCRGIGVVLVILYHMGYEQFRNAWFVISLFFSLSGFIMTKNTVEAFERRGFVDVQKFWAKRVSRLFPALFLTLIVILLSQKLPFRKNDGVAFQRESSDIFYTTIFLTNYNLAYNQVDDYFNEFATPSITRHMWTLAIEEQYYIVWPLLLLVLTKLIKMTSTPNNRYKKVDRNRKTNRFVISGTSKRCVKAIFMLDIVVMIVSYISSRIIIEEYDTTAAYYSTSCRMGDIAAGGFTYSSVRLIPYLSRRWYKDPALPPMTFKTRVILELMVGTLLFMLVSVPMIQTPVDEMLLLYFERWRLIVSLMLFGVVASTIQLNEPLPRWAIASKIVSFYPLIILGVISYGVYVFHWPLVVYFGDPVGINRKKVALGWSEPYDGILGYDGRNAFLFVVVVVTGYISFAYFEKPLLLLSKVTRPKKTIASGFISLQVTLLINWWITKDLPPMAIFENNQEAFEESFDARFTPIFYASTVMKSKRSLFLEVLDYKTRSVFPEKFLDESYNKTVADYSNAEFVDSDAYVIIVCKNLAHQLYYPCEDPDVWNDNTYWFWLDSEVLCGTDPIVTDLMFRERCDDVISISELPVFVSPISVDIMRHNEFLEELGSQLYSMIFEVEKAQPGVLNQDFLSRFRAKYKKTIVGDKQLSLQNVMEKSWDPIRILMLGDSVGVRIGMFWNDIAEMDMSVLDDDPFPSIDVQNLASGGLPAVAYFACLSTHPKYQYDNCHQFTKNSPSVVMKSFETTRPDIVFLHDGHLSRDDGQYGGVFGDGPEKMGLGTFFEKVMAFNIMMNEAKISGVEHLIFATISRVDALNVTEIGDNYFKELNIIMQTVDTLGCPKDDPSGMWMTVLDWAKFVCPTVEDFDVCKQNVHGFDMILPDKIHPSGDSGLWLTREALALVSVASAKYSIPDKYGSYSSWDEAIENPIAKQMLKLAPPDGDPPLKDLLSSYYLCPYKDLENMEKDYNRTEFPNYKSYRDSMHYNDFDAEKNLDMVDLDATLYGDSNEHFDWYTRSNQTAKRFANRVVLNGPDPSQLNNSAVVDWEVNETHVHLLVAAPTNGYVGFGLADAGGGFIGADMVFLESGNPDSLRDTYTTEEGKPQTDDCLGHWELINSKIRKNHMFFETVRMLDTGDAQDKKITNDSNPLTPAHRVLVAWGDSAFVDSIEENHSKGSIRFFQEKAIESFDSVMEREANDYFTIQAVNFKVTETETNYFRTCLTKEEMIAKGVPRMDGKLHLIGFEPIIQSKNSAYVHHYLLFGSTSDNCDGNFEELIWFWGSGLNSLMLPDFLGLPFNGEHEFNSFKLHIHYNNPLLRSDIVDSSGVRMYWTSNVRETEMGVFNMGDPWVKKNYEPLGKGLSQHDFVCPSSCSESFMDQPITVFQEVHHTHRLGVQTVVDHFRNGKKIRSGKVEYFDWYTLGDPLVIQEPFIVEPGDSFTMSCYFEDEPDLDTVFGFGAKDEMCVGAYFYYPKVKKDDWRCGYKVGAEECCSSYKRTHLSDTEELGRSFPFGDQGEGCPADP